MVFSSTIFILLFLPVVLLCYFLVPKKIKNYVLLIFSLIFYIFGGPKFILVLLGVVLIDYIGAILIEKTSKRKLFLIISVSLNIAVLFYYKYTGFFLTNVNYFLGFIIKIPNIVMPIGISFYTFQSLSYVIDVYRRKVKLQTNYFTLLLYVSLFPQLVAGPIVRYETIEKELENRSTTFDDFVAGLVRFILGLAKKVIIANQVGALADIIFKSTNLTTPVAWLGAISYTIQIYFDFSAYSDMAIGLGKIFGFKFLENFNFPYIAKSITDFWRRWHISLSTWFRDYIYIPLGGNRKGLKRQIINLFIVWVLTGFWHGAAWNFLIWGLYYFIFLILEKFVFGKYLVKMPSFLRHIYTLFIVIIGWVIFRCESLSKLKQILVLMFNFTITKTGINELIIYLETYFVYLILGIMFSMPIYYKIINSVKNLKRKRLQTFLNIIYYLGLIILFVITLMFLAYSSYNPFIYFRF